MLWTLFAILTMLWLLGIATSVTLGGLIHVLPTIAVGAVVISLIRDARYQTKNRTTK